jgi:flagellar assembly protein FliH
MTSTSTEAGARVGDPAGAAAPASLPHRTVLRDLPAGSVTGVGTGHDLREGVWTRLGAGSVLGDAATEGTLEGLAERSRAAARAQGFAAGWAEGLRAAAARTAETHEAQVRVFDEHAATFLAAQRSALAAVETAARRCAETAAEVQHGLSGAALDLALQLVEAVLGRELEVATDPGADALRRALATVPVDVPLVARLHPADLATLDRTTVGERSVSFVADPSVARGDAVVESDSGVVDATVGAALARVREVLGR